MRTILLAIDGAAPHEEAVRYSLGLAQRLRARLEVLQVVSPAVEKGWRTIVKGLRKGGRVFESSMAAAAFAEAGEPEAARSIQAMLCKISNSLDQPGAERFDDVNYEVTFKVGDAEREIVRFVEEHRDVMLAVYDDASKGAGYGLPASLRQKLTIPTLAVERKADTGESI